MSKKTTVGIIILIVLIALAGIGVIVIPPYLQDKQLTEESEEYDDLAESLRVVVTQAPRETPSPINTVETTETITPNETEVGTSTQGWVVRETPTAEGSEAVTPGNAPPAEATEQSTDSAIPSETPGGADGWNPFAGEQTSGKMGLFATQQPDSKKEDNGNGLRFGRYNNNSDNIAPVDNPDSYNKWLEDKLKTPTPSPVPTPTPKPTPTPPPTPTPSPTPRIGANTNIDLTECKNQNGDFIAWIQIPDTNINYPVVKTNDTEYYLTHTFNGKKSDLGTLFSLGKCDWKTPGKNIVIYGHHVEGSGNKMFKALLKYKDESYFKNHRIIYLDSMHHFAKYEIFAAFDMTEGDFEPSVTSFAKSSEFLDFVYTAKDLTKYDTGVVVNEEDKILTLVTCDRYFKRAVGRFVVMAKKIE